MIIVTGANGFIGSHLTRDLLNRGCNSVVAVDTVSPTERQEPLSGLSCYHFMSDKQLLLELSHLSSVQAIFHIGACSSTTETNWSFLKENNIEYSKKLFKFATQKGIPFLYASSAATYGDGQLGFDDSSDSSCFKPLNLYGRSKLEFDLWALAQKEHPPIWFGFRYFNVYGPNEYHKGEMASVAYKAFLQIRKNKSLQLFRSHHPDYKDGEQKRDFVYVKDISRWMLEIFDSAHSFQPGVYNMGTGQARTWLDLAELAFASLDMKMNIEWIDIPESLKNQYQYFTEAKMNRLYSQGLSAPQYSLELGISDYFKNYLLKRDHL